MPQKWCFALAAIAWSLIGGTPGHAHPVPDGVIFRGIQVVVWSERIEIRYQVGLHDNMVQRELRAALELDTEIPSEGGQALRAYRDLLFPQLPEKLTVTIDGQPQVLQPRRADIIRQLHVQIELVYRIDFAVSATPAHFLLIDENFAGVPGYHLAAIKSRGLVEIPESDAVSVLSRLSREPETEEDLRILSTPVRHVEAMIAAVIPGNDTEVPDDTTAPSGDPSTSTDERLERAEARSPTDHEANSRSAAMDRPASGDALVTSSGDVHPRDGDRQWIVWPLFGGLLILAAMTWMFLNLRRS